MKAACLSPRVAARHRTPFKRCSRHLFPRPECIWDFSESQETPRNSDIFPPYVHGSWILFTVQTSSRTRRYLFVRPNRVNLKLCTRPIHFSVFFVLHPKLNLEAHLRWGVGLALFERGEKSLITHWYHLTKQSTLKRKLVFLNNTISSQRKPRCDLVEWYKYYLTR